jgi:hypothetical protein
MSLGGSATRSEPRSSPRTSRRRHENLKLPPRLVTVNPLAHRLSESCCTPFDCFLRPLTSFQAHPCLGRLDEAAQLLEHGAGGCAFAFELFDPVEPGQHRASLVHPTTVAVENARLCRQTVPS